MKCDQLASDHCFISILVKQEVQNAFIVVRAHFILVISQEGSLHFLGDMSYPIF